VEEMVGVRDWVGVGVFVWVRVAVEVTVEVGEDVGCGVWVCVGERVWVEVAGDISVATRVKGSFITLHADRKKENMRLTMMKYRHRGMRSPFTHYRGKPRKSHPSGWLSK
jgi:hypothetical protein